MNCFRVIGFVLLFWVFFLLGVVAGYCYGRIGNYAEAFTQESREHRKLELDIADMESRLATLERIGVEINVRDKTNTWFVLDGKVAQ